MIAVPEIYMYKALTTSLSHWLIAQTRLFRLLSKSFLCNVHFDFYKNIHVLIHPNNPFESNLFFRMS